MGYCPDCGWDGYTEGVNSPCADIEPVPEVRESLLRRRRERLVEGGRITTEMLAELGFNGSGGYIGIGAFGPSEDRQPGYART